MKKLLLLLFTSFILCCCDNDDDTPTTNPIDQLPPATQIGANKVGCLLDGVAFLPDNSPNSTNCFYQFVNGEYYFILNFNNSNNNNFKAITLGTEKLSISVNQTLNLFERIEGSAFGTYTNEINDYTTDNIYTGELIITRLSNQIVSGTFWFDVVDNNGIVHQIREGRFDMQYTN
jgi:hypothetical protein